MTFLSPFILMALLALPALWLLLRVTPPPAKIITLPTTRFLDGLIADEQESQSTPWWILLLRLLILTLIIIGLAGPITRPNEQILTDTNSPLRIVINNGWASAPHWNTIQKQAIDLISQAGTSNRTIILWPLAQNTQQPTATTSIEALSQLKTLRPQSWEADLLTHLRDYKSAGKAVETVWLDHGIKHAGLEGLTERLADDGSLKFIAPKPQDISFILRNDTDAPLSNPAIFIESAASEQQNGTPLRINIIGSGGQLIDSITTNYAEDKYQQMRIALKLPAKTLSAIETIKLAHPKSAGTTLLKNASESYKTIGIVGTRQSDSSTPLIEAQYYLNRALKPYGDIHVDALEKLLDIENVSVLILPDIAAIDTKTLERLDMWTKNGGILIRFAGPNMAQSNLETMPLLPVTLRQGGRMMDGSMTWDTPAKLDNFPNHSPLSNLDITEDLEIKRQLLAQPSDDLKNKSWALLDDGSPIITGAPYDRGLIALIHVTATPQWSDLPLTGQFVEILKTIIQLTPANLENIQSKGNYEALTTLDGFGDKHSPSQDLNPIAGKILSEQKPSSLHPAGIYTRGGRTAVHNVGDNTTKLVRIENDQLPTHTTLMHYNTSFQKNFTPHCFIWATILFLIDWLVMYAIVLAPALKSRKIFTTCTAALLLTLSSSPDPASAREQDSLKYARTTYLAYVITGDQAIDQTSQTGLSNLAKILTQRTTVEPDGVAALNLEKDDLTFFPFIYWPITSTQPRPSSDAIRKLQNYMDHGGTIVFDTRDQPFAPNNAQGLRLSPSRNIKHMRNLTHGLSIPALHPIPTDHVLRRSFYLLKTLPGRYDGGTLWVEKNLDNGHDGVSRAIVGSNDWASAWATKNASLNLKGGARQRDYALRFGVNLALYTLTGQYKADQVHMKYILERLGK